MLNILSDIPNFDTNIFDCVSIKNEYTLPANSANMLDYMLTSYARNENIAPFQYINIATDVHSTAFSVNQSDIIHIATSIFASSESLGSFESDVLNKTLKRLIKTTPTLAGRK